MGVGLHRTGSQQASEDAYLWTQAPRRLRRWVVYFSHVTALMDLGSPPSKPPVSSDSCIYRVLSGGVQRGGRDASRMFAVFNRMTPCACSK